MCDVDLNSEEWQRLHWPAFLIGIANNVRNLIFGAPFFFSNNFAPRLIGLSGVGIGVTASLVQFLTFRYRLTDGALILRGGLIKQWERVLPFGRIQSVDVVRKLRHRAFGVVELRIEAIGGSSTEAHLSAIRPEEANRIRNAVLRAPERQVGEVAEPPELARLGPKDLLVAGVTGGRVPVLALLLANLQELLPQDRLLSFVTQLPHPTSPISTVIILIVVFLLIAVAISLLLTVFTYWGFTLKREGKRLVISRGLLETRQASIPINRIQAVWINQNLIRRMADLASLTVVVAGHSGRGNEAQETSVLLPISKKPQAIRLAREVLGFEEDWQDRLVEGPRPALARRLIYAAVIPLPFLIAGVINFGGLGLLLLGAFPLSAGLAFGLWKALGHALNPRYVVIRSGVILRRLMIVPIDNVQSLTIGSSPVQRALKLSTLRLSVPKAEGRIRDVAEELGAQRFVDIESTMIGSGRRATRS